MNTPNTTICLGQLVSVDNRTDIFGLIIDKTEDMHFENGTVITGVYRALMVLSEPTHTKIAQQFGLDPEEHIAGEIPFDLPDGSTGFAVCWIDQMLTDQHITAVHDIHMDWDDLQVAQYLQDHGWHYESEGNEHDYLCNQVSLSNQVFGPSIGDVWSKIPI